MDNLAMYLEDLGQTVYSGIHKFTVISSIDDDAWSVHIGFRSSSARWWKGVFRDKDLTTVVGSNVTDMDTKVYAAALAESFVKGAMDIIDWSPKKGAKLKLVLAADTPYKTTVPLTELSVEAAGIYSMELAERTVFDARDREGRMFPGDSVSVPRPAAPGDTPVTARRSSKNGTASSPKTVKEYKVDSAAEAANLKLQADERKKDAEERKKEAAERTKKRGRSGSPELKPAAPVRKAVIGASLNNPTKRARKVVAQTFDSDSD